MNVHAPQVFVQITIFDHLVGVVCEINLSPLMKVARVELVFWSERSLTNTILFIEILLRIKFCVDYAKSDAHRAEIRTHTSESVNGEADLEPAIGAYRDNLCATSVLQIKVVSNDKNAIRR
jgi:hypothetical protein